MIAIPDIHGEWDRLSALLDILDRADKGDPKNMIFLGDYVDRGPRSCEVLAILKYLQEEGAIILKGNHEGLMINAVLKSQNEWLWDVNGGIQTKRSYKDRYHNDWETALIRDAEWLQDLPLYHETETEFFSHAPLPPLLYNSSQFPDWRLALINEKIMTWSYFQPEEDAFEVPGKMAYCGHVHAVQIGLLLPRFYRHYGFLDAGCGCHPSAPLVAFDTETKTLYIDDWERKTDV